MKKEIQYKYDNGVLICEEHKTPIYKNKKNGFFCLKCYKDRQKKRLMNKLKAMDYYDQFRLIPIWVLQKEVSIMKIICGGLKNDSCS